MSVQRTEMAKKLWCLFRRRDAADHKICVAHAEDGRVFRCPYSNEAEAKEKCEDYAFNTHEYSVEEGVE